mmetsp:Transcript_43608/g.123249  ORF Transcript_43608/g.123249 Transcript_43608/m.123249 type:complete len:237 (+) Transcript_43608:226-936(+)
MMMPSHSDLCAHSQTHSFKSLCPCTGSKSTSTKFSAPLPLKQFVADCVGQASSARPAALMPELPLGEPPVGSSFNAVVANWGLILRSNAGMSSHLEMSMFFRRWQFGVVASFVSCHTTPSHPSVVSHTSWHSFVVKREGYACSPSTTRSPPLPGWQFFPAKEYHSGSAAAELVATGFNHMVKRSSASHCEICTSARSQQLSSTPFLVSFIMMPMQSTSPRHPFSQSLRDMCPCMGS